MKPTFKFVRKDPNFMPIVYEPDSFTLTLRHIGAWTKITKATAAVVTMQPLGTTDPAEGVIEQNGAGNVTFSALTGSGISVRCRGFASTLATNAQYSPIAWKWDPVLREFNVSGDVTVT